MLDAKQAALLAEQSRYNRKITSTKKLITIIEEEIKNAALYGRNSMLISRHCTAWDVNYVNIETVINELRQANYTVIMKKTSLWHSYAFVETDNIKEVSALEISFK